MVVAIVTLFITLMPPTYKADSKQEGQSIKAISYNVSEDDAEVHSAMIEWMKAKRVKDSLLRKRSRH